MELGLSLGDSTKPFTSGLMTKARDQRPMGLGFCMALSIGPGSVPATDGEDRGKSDDDRENGLLQLDLLPNTPVPRYTHAFPWPSSDNGSCEAGSSGQMAAARGLELNRAPAAEVSSPNKRDSDEDENEKTRKKLRLSKEQSVFLEESFKEHNTLNPVSSKQKLALAKQLNLRPRQVEVWFQNRRARRKLKQTEVECEYLKRCCETLTEENRRLKKELQELRAFKSSKPFYMQLPATTLTICPSCDRANKPRFYPFPQPHHQSNTS